ncbi:molecular chaperone Hsp33 [Terrimicrobium sacchariphilum]|jgi:molecular chaperone Hsp33|uniref:Molecular chaperone Hsp33 n=1 Tax=Terrimicrobium sacchariphilum TaxID=690879 RepID=A0A146G2F1_TERSA|nr:Hsp33 family molecular chaperone HslO [Terrimicrobium sacchariphilum]GAT32039.1 molecular chaperone Hsp33 [Terrimicrobium sacchariphilum]
MSEVSEDQDRGIEVRTYFARVRNALVARADFGELYASLYLHQMDAGIRLEPVMDDLLREALAAVTLHCASRPWKETVAWTVNFQHPLANVFVSGDNRLGTVVGNIFTENVRETDKNLFYADVVTEDQPQRRSVVEFEGGSFFRAMEKFYEQSEQRVVRIFPYDEEEFVLIAAQPDCDIEWLKGLDAEAVKTLDKDVELRLLEQRYYRFACGCNQDRMLAMLAPVMRHQPEDLFQGEETIRVSCPRCGARHTITRESLEARIATEKSSG